MKICHVTSAHESDDIRILHKECVSLAKVKGNDVYLVARGDSYEYNGVHVVGIGKLPSGRISRMIQGSKVVFEKALSIDADIYHLHDPELLLHAKKIVKKGKKVIFDSHEYYYKQILEKHYIPRIMRQAIAKAYFNIESRACKLLSAVIFPCPIDGKHPFEGRAKNCIYIDNLPLLDEMIYEDNLEKKDVHKPKVCCVGSLTHERGITQLVKACYAANVELILGGDFSPISFETEIKESKEFSIVDYRGYCNRKEIKDIYQTADIGASTILPVGQYPIIWNFPTKVYEYMMQGLPFVISDFVYNKKMIEQYQCGITVNPYDVEEIASAIRYLVDNPKEAKTMGENGRRAIKEKFNWSIEEKKLYNLYEMVMEDNNK